MTRFLLVRHGETDWNALHRMQGRSDIPLNDRGRAQAGFAAEALKDTKIDAIYASPLKRAMETAEIIKGGRPLVVQPAPALIEINLGDWEGHTPEDVDVLYPGQYDVWRNQPGEIQLPQGENFHDVQARAYGFFQKLAEQDGDKTILLVSHMGCLSTILLQVAGLPLNDMWKHPITNCGLSEIDVENGKASVTVWGRDDYIPAEYKMAKPFGRVGKNN